MVRKVQKRAPEESEEMANYKEVLTYYKAHQVLRKKYWDLYDLVSRNILQNVKISPGKILDVACGYGGLMNGLNKYCKNVEFVGIDLSKSMIKVGKKYISNKKIKFYIMSADKMSFKEGSFDYILCKDSFHHFNNPLKVLREMYSVLKKGGSIYSIDLRRDAPEEVIYQIVQLASQLNVENAILYLESNRASFTIKEMKTLLKKAGIRRYKIFVPKIKKSFLKDYGLKSNDYLTASVYLKDKWVLIIKK